MFNETTDDIFRNSEESENNNDLSKIDLSIIKNISIGYTDWTVDAIIGQLENGNIDLDPSYQRREAWDDFRKSKYIESLILGFPVPQIVLAEKSNSRGKFYVIDGKQRLLTIASFSSIASRYDKEENFKLKGLNFRDDLNNLNYDSFSNDFRYSDDYASFQNTSIRTVVIKNWKDENILYEIFYRLNTGSLPLSPQELRKALIPGDFVNFIEKASFDVEGIRKILNISKPDYRMRDVELLIRYYAFKLFLTEYQGNLKKFLDYTCDTLNKSFQGHQADYINLLEDLNEAINAVYTIFGDKDAFRKYKNDTFENRFNKPIYDVMVYFLSDENIRKIALSNPLKVKESFIELCRKEQQFIESIEFSTKNIKPTFNRFSLWSEYLAHTLSISTPKFELSNENKITIK